jgi:steroid 5-alpha reductase family enzyme
MTFLQVYLWAGVLILALMTAVWLLSLALRDSSIVDIFWGPGFVITNGLYFLLAPEGALSRKILITVLVTLWGLRLGTHILWRNWGKEEDYRYRNWRQQAGGSWWWRSFFKVFLLQGILMWIVSAPLLAAQIGSMPAGLGVLDALGIGIWLLGFSFEALGDWQLARFKANPANKGKLLTSGVWRYSRHPNYFGDAAQWWAYYLIAAAAGGWATIFSPILMTTLLVRVSGVAMLERTLKKVKPGYEEYTRTTSAFVPWFPRTRQP